MTTNQINYWKNVETERSNRANEAIKEAEYEESVRHNKALESMELRKVTETERNNAYMQSETARHNLAVEEETARHQSAQDTLGILSLNESIRTHQANESIGWANIGLGYANVALGYSNIALGYYKADQAYELGMANLDEDIRYHDLITAETERSNLANEELKSRAQQEIERHNQIEETWEMYNIMLGPLKLLPKII